MATRPNQPMLSRKRGVFSIWGAQESTKQIEAFKLLVVLRIISYVPHSSEPMNVPSRRHRRRSFVVCATTFAYQCDPETRDAMLDGVLRESVA